MYRTIYLVLAGRDEKTRSKGTLPIIHHDRPTNTVRFTPKRHCKSYKLPRTRTAPLLGTTKTNSKTLKKLLGKTAITTLDFNLSNSSCRNRWIPKPLSVIRKEQRHKKYPSNLLIVILQHTYSVIPSLDYSTSPSVSEVDNRSLKIHHKYQYTSSVS